MAITLKRYQETTLAALKDYLEAARTVGAARAFNKSARLGIRDPRSYQPLKGLDAVPYVCLRLPTGGGKTLLSAHSIKIAADSYLEREYPLVLWLVPTNMIRNQTLETLKKPDHPNYEALRRAFDGRFRVLDITDFANLTPDDLAQGACVIVATMQTLGVKNKEARKVYANNEYLEPHFTTIPAHVEGMDAKDGKILYSFANLLAWHRPLVLVDEAHNNKAPLRLEVLQRIRTACVIEFTATPADNSNLLHNVSATELKAEEMIKLPIRLSEQNTWEEAVRDAILQRAYLEGLATQDSSYIRPIILFQAEEKGKDVTKEVLLAHLMEQEHIPREKIAVVTGDQKELDGINLFARDCPIDYVITVEALKEGWDCSFAYVFCSVASVHSAKDVEQLLGRVLRLPYAKRRSHPDLNCAYAYTAKASWKNAVGKLHDSLVQMGFDDTEAMQAVEKSPPPALDLQGGKYEGGQSVPRTTFELHEDVTAFVHHLSEAVTVEAIHAGGCRISLQGNVPEDAIEALVKQLPAEAANQVKAEIRIHNATVARNAAPCARGVAFAVPQLCLWLDDEWIAPDSDSLLHMHGWNLLDYSEKFEEADFRVTEQGIAWEIDLNLEGSLTERHIGHTEQYDLNLQDMGWSVGMLCGWLERRCRQPDITHPVLLEFVRRAVQYLLEVRHIAMPTLVRWRFVLAKLLLQRIAHNRGEAGKNAYQQCLFAPQTITVETRADYAFPFTANGYAPHWNYAGRTLFNKHYYANVGELKGDGEEYECAKAIDMHVCVKHWVRNLVKRGFWLPLADSKFYPDFVAELNDGRILVVEHKGQDRISNDDSKQKANVGALWEERSNGKALFLMTTVEKGKPSLSEQIKGKVG